MRTIVVTNEKGGVGKTTLACHLAWHLAEESHRVVVLDFDRQCHSASILSEQFETIGSLQSLLTYEPEGGAPTLGVFENSEQVFELLNDGPEQLSHMQSYAAAILERLAPHFDYCIIDTAPAWDGRNLLAMVVADYVAIPMRMDQSVRRALDEVSKSIEAANRVRQAADLERVRFAFVFNQVQARSSLAEQLIARIRETMPDHVVPTDIPVREHLTEATFLKVPVWRLDKDTRRSAPVVRKVVSYIVDQADRKAA